jgi:hypothetical protein
MKKILTLSYILIQTISSKALEGEGWAIPSSEFRKGGVEFVVCNDLPDEILCLGISCVGNGYELVSVRSGSGPFTGVTKISTASGDFTAVFSDKEKPIGVVSSGTRARVSRDVIKAMAASHQFSIRETHPDPDEDRFSGAHLAELMKRTKGACPPLN